MAIVSAAEGRPDVACATAFRTGFDAAGGMAQGFRVNLNIQPRAFAERRFFFGGAFGMMFIEEGAFRRTLELDGVLGYQHFQHDVFAPFLQSYGGVAWRDGEPRPNLGVDAGTQIDLHPEFDLRASVGSSMVTRCRSASASAPTPFTPPTSLIFVIAVRRNGEWDELVDEGPMGLEVIEASFPVDGTPSG